MKLTNPLDTVLENITGADIASPEYSAMFGQVAGKPTSGIQLESFLDLTQG